MKAFFFFLIALVMVIAGCEVAEEPEPMAQFINGEQIALDGTNLKKFYQDGFLYHDHQGNLATEDRVFAIFGENAIQLRFTDNPENPWIYESVGLAYLRQFSNLSVVGQISSFMNYQYYPEVGELRLNDGTVVKKYMSEYSPPYWIWAWNSFMFIREGRLFIFVINVDGTYTSLGPISISEE